MERLTQEEFMKLSPKEQFEYKIYWIDLGRANVKKCYKKYHKEVLKPLGFVRDGSKCAWHYDLGWANIQMELLPSRSSTEIFVMVGINLLWHNLGAYNFAYSQCGDTEIKRVKYDPDILKIEEMLNSEMTEIIKNDILDFFLPMKDPIYAFNKTLSMLVKSNGYIHTMYKQLHNLAIFIDDTGALVNSLLPKEEELEIIEEYRAKGILTPEEAKAMRKELVDKINKNRSENMKLLSWKDYIAE